MVVPPHIVQLPSRVSALWEEVAKLTRICSALELPVPSVLPETRETVRLAENAISFGTKTVNVAAALKVYFSPTAAAVKKALGLQKSLPAALVSRLQALHSDFQSSVQPGKSSQAAEGPQA